MPAFPLASDNSQNPSYRRSLEPTQEELDEFRDPNYEDAIYEHPPVSSSGRHSRGILGEPEPVSRYRDENLDKTAEAEEIEVYTEEDIDYHPHPFMSALALACFFPTGFAAAGYDREVSWYSHLGNHYEARSSAKKSIIWSWISIFLGLLLFIGAGIAVAQAYGTDQAIIDWFKS